MAALLLQDGVCVRILEQRAAPDTALPGHRHPSAVAGRAGRHRRRAGPGVGGRPDPPRRRHRGRREARARCPSRGVSAASRSSCPCRRRARKPSWNGASGSWTAAPLLRGATVTGLHDDGATGHVGRRHRGRAIPDSRRPGHGRRRRPLHGPAAAGHAGAAQGLPGQLPDGRLRRQHRVRPGRGAVPGSRRDRGVLSAAGRRAALGGQAAREPARMRADRRGPLAADSCGNGPASPSTPAPTACSAASASARAWPSRMVHGRTVLIGDAAHEISPIGGQGMNLGWLDAAELAPLVLSRLARRGRGARSCSALNATGCGRPPGPPGSPKSTWPWAGPCPGRCGVRNRLIGYAAAVPAMNSRVAARFTMH